MENDDNKAISAKTWARTADVISKSGYMDGAADGQVSTYQNSFDLGYEQGLQFGIIIGKFDACKGNSSHENKHSEKENHSNCQICINGLVSEQNIMSLVKNQEKCNEQFLQNKLINNT